MKLISLKPIVKKGAIALPAVCLLMALLAWGLTGGDYELSQSTIAGGGGTCSGGDFILPGTLSQPAAGVMTGGDFMLAGGYGVIINTAPVACIVDGNQTVECEGYWGATVTLDGSCSTDPDSAPGTNDDIVYFDWYEGDTLLASGEIIDCNLPLGEHIIILEVIDKAGAFDANGVTIIVQDTTPPVITLNGSATVVLECGVDSYTEEGATATDLCDPDVPVVIGGDTVDPSTCGTYAVTYEATDASGNVAEVTRVVDVVDTTPPVITLNGSATVVLECGVDSYIEEGATATDLCDPDVPVVIGGDTVDPSTCGTYVVTYDATDSWGNEVVQVTRTVNVVDMMAPTINSVSVSPRVLWAPNHRMVDVTVTVDAEDICDPIPVCSIVDVTSNEPIDGPGDGNTEPDWESTGDLTLSLRAERAGGGIGRVYTIHVECTDASGNTTTATVEVTVPHDQGKGKK